MKGVGRTALIGAAMIMAMASTADAYAQGRGNQGRGQGQRQGQQQAQGQQQGRGGRGQQGPSGNAATVQQRAEIRQTLRNRDIYGGDLMSAEERRQYRDRVNAATSDRQWAAIREQHMNDMRARARAEGRPLDPPIYGEHMMTRQERNEYREQMQAAVSDAERARLRAAHMEMIRERAMMLGMDPPAAE